MSKESETGVVGVPETPWARAIKATGLVGALQKLGGVDDTIMRQAAVKDIDLMAEWLEKGGLGFSA